MGIDCECGLRAQIELMLFEVGNPKVTELKPIMREIAVKGWPLVDYTKSYEEILAQLFRHAKKINKERKNARRRS